MWRKFLFLYYNLSLLHLRLFFIGYQLSYHRNVFLFSSSRFRSFILYIFIYLWLSKCINQSFSYIFQCTNKIRASGINIIVIQYILVKIHKTSELLNKPNLKPQDCSQEDPNRYAKRFQYTVWQCKYKYTFSHLKDQHNLGYGRNAPQTIK